MYTGVWVSRKLQEGTSAVLEDAFQRVPFYISPLANLQQIGLMHFKRYARHMNMDMDMVIAIRRL